MKENEEGKKIIKKRSKEEMVSLFNGITNLVDYLMPKPSL